MDWHPTLGRLYFTENSRDWLSEDIPEDKLNRVAQPGKDNLGYPCASTDTTAIHFRSSVGASMSENRTSRRGDPLDCYYDGESRQYQRETPTVQPLRVRLAVPTITPSVVSYSSRSQAPPPLTYPRNRSQA